MYLFLLMAYRSHRITAAQVWQKADEGVITAAQATSICGPRPNE